MPDVIGMVKELAAAVAGFIGYQSKKLDLKNTAPVQQAAAAQQEANAQAKTAAAIANRDVQETQKDLAE